MADKIVRFPVVDSGWNAGYRLEQYDPSGSCWLITLRPWEGWEGDREVRESISGIGDLPKPLQQFAALKGVATLGEFFAVYDGASFRGDSRRPWELCWSQGRRPSREQGESVSPGQLLIVDPPAAAADKAKRQAFAAEQRRRLGEMGFGPEAASRIITAAGPGLAVMAAEAAKTIGREKALLLTGGVLYTKEHCSWPGWGPLYENLRLLAVPLPEGWREGSAKNFLHLVRGMRAAAWHIR